MKYQVLAMGLAGIPGPPGLLLVRGRGPPGAGASREARAGLCGACRDGTLLRIAPPGLPCYHCGEGYPRASFIKTTPPKPLGKDAG